jgi:hypothetical protein
MQAIIPGWRDGLESFRYAEMLESRWIERVSGAAAERPA